MMFHDRFCDARDAFLSEALGVAMIEVLPGRGVFGRWRFLPARGSVRLVR